MRMLKARFRARDEFLEAYDGTEGAGTLFVATTRALAAAEPVIVELLCDGLPNPVLIRGTALQWRAAVPRLRVRAGATITFDASEAEKCRFVLATLAGERTSPRRKHARIPITLPVRYRLVPGPIEMVDGSLSEISAGGALLEVPSIALATEVIIELVPPGGAAAIPITGRVTYHTPTGSGLKFIYRDGGGSRRLRELIRRLCIE